MDAIGTGLNVHSAEADSMRIEFCTVWTGTKFAQFDCSHASKAAITVYHTICCAKCLRAKITFLRVNKTFR